MSGTTGLSSSNNLAQDASSKLTQGDADVGVLIGEMKAAFLFATQTNLRITIEKTIDGSLETVAQQRPNIG